MSFSIDVNAILASAQTWVSVLLQIYSLPLGITLALGIIGMLISTFAKAFRGGR